MQPPTHPLELAPDVDGAGVQVDVLPLQPAYGRSVALLVSDGAKVLLTSTTSPAAPPEEFSDSALPWRRIVEELRLLR